jgi:hypothetical protein
MNDVKQSLFRALDLHSADDIARLKKALEEERVICDAYTGGRHFPDCGCVLGHLNNLDPEKAGTESDRLVEDENLFRSTRPRTWLAAIETWLIDNEDETRELVIPVSLRNGSRVAGVLITEEARTQLLKWIEEYQSLCSTWNNQTYETNR